MPTKEVQEELEEKSDHSRSEGKEAKSSENKNTNNNNTAAKKKKKAVPELSDHELNANYGIGHKLLKSMGWKGVRMA